MKVNKTAVHNAIMKYQNEGVFIDKKGSSQLRVTTNREDYLLRKASYSLSNEYVQKIQPKLMKTGTEVSTKTIQRKLSLEFGLKSCKPARNHA